MPLRRLRFRCAVLWRCRAGAVQRQPSGQHSPDRREATRLHDSGQVSARLGDAVPDPREAVVGGVAPRGRCLRSGDRNSHGRREKRGLSERLNPGTTGSRRLRHVASFDWRAPPRANRVVCRPRRGYTVLTIIFSSGAPSSAGLSPVSMNASRRVPSPRSSAAVCASSRANAPVAAPASLRRCRFRRSRYASTAVAAGGA